MSARFTWNIAKDRANQRKHGVSFEEALTVFADGLAVIHDDPDHSAEERREIIVGHSNAGRLLLVSFTERDRAIRLISARKATRGEHEDYQKVQRR